MFDGSSASTMVCATACRMDVGRPPASDRDRRGCHDRDSCIVCRLPRVPPLSRHTSTARQKLETRRLAASRGATDVAPCYASCPCAACWPSCSVLLVYSARSARLYAIRPIADACRSTTAGCASRLEETHSTTYCCTCVVLVCSWKDRS